MALLSTNLSLNTISFRLYSINREVFLNKKEQVVLSLSFALFMSLLRAGLTKLTNRYFFSRDINKNVDAKTKAPRSLKRFYYKQIVT